MHNMFVGFLGYNEKAFKELWKESIFVIDANTLIDFYRYTNKENTTIFFDILKNLKNLDRLWVPHQVALEYFFNLGKNIDKPREGYSKLCDDLKKLKDEANKTFKNIQSNYPYINTENFKVFLERQAKSNEIIDEILKKEKEQLPDVQTIKSDILTLLDNIVGEAFSQKRIDEIENKGKDRYALSIPPGFKDTNKNKKERQEYRVYGKMKYQRLYGDLILWEQMIEKSIQIKKPIIFITAERKEDWWEKEKENDKIIRPQPHLLQEFLERTGMNFYMYSTDAFVKWAKDFMTLGITDEQVKSVESEVDILRKKDENQKHRSLIAEPHVTDYLTEEENELFDNMISDAHGFDVDSNGSLIKVLNQRASASIPKMENKYFELIHLMSHHNPSAVYTAIRMYEELPNESYSKSNRLLSIIKFLEDSINYYEGQGY